MSELKAPTLDQIAYLKLRLRTIPDELNLAREALTRLSAEVREQKTVLAEHEAEAGAFVRAQMIADTKGKKPSEETIKTAIKMAVEQNEGCRRLRMVLRETGLRCDGAELTVKHLTDRFLGLQSYADLTCAEVRLLVGGLGV
jgi:hypothetical protein